MESKAAERNHHGANVRRWREWRGINQDVLAEQLGVSQATLSGYEKRDRLEPELVERIAGVLNIPAQAITELNEGATINIFSGTWNDSASASANGPTNRDIESQNDTSGSNITSPTFNPLDKVVELYDRLLKAEQEKVTMLQEMLKEKK